MLSLIVAPDGVSRTAGVRVLESMGMDVIEASTAARARELARTACPDLIFVDQRLDLDGGIGCLADLTAWSTAYPIYCAADIQPDMLRRALEAGAMDYVIGPLDPHILSLKLALARASGRVQPSGPRLRVVGNA